MDWLAPLPQADTPRQLVTSAGTWSRAALAADARALGAALLAGGARPGDIVLAPLPAWALARLFFACAATGLTLFPLDPAAPPQRRQHLLALAGPRGRLLEALPEFSSGVASEMQVQMGDGQKVISASLPLLPLPDQPALVIATSGSEGDPKGVVLSHGNLAAAAAASSQRLPLGPGDTWLACLPLHHVGGQSILTRCAQAGATARVLDAFSVEAVADALAGGSHSPTAPITHLSLVPAMLDRLLAAGVAPGPLRHVLIGGAALSRTLFNRAREAGWPLAVSYGLSECAAQVATWVNPGPDWQEGQVGSPLPGCRATVREDGRLVLQGPQVMWGYLNPQGQPGQGLEMPEDSNGTPAFVTGDLAAQDEAGRLTILGRADDMLISGGINVHPAEVESLLLACPGIADAGVTALPDPVWGDRLVALVAGTIAPDALLQWCREHLPSSRRPRRLHRVESLPRNPMGKLQRPALRELAQRLEAATPANSSATVVTVASTASNTSTAVRPTPAAGNTP